MSDLVKLDNVKVVNGVAFVLTSTIEGDAELHASIPTLTKALYDKQKLTESGIHGAMLAETGEDAPDEDLVAFYVMETCEEVTEDYLVSVSSITWIENIGIMVVNAFVGYPENVSEWGD